MTKQLFKPNVEEDLNRLHNVSLTEGQMSTILYIMEGYINPSDDYSYDPDFREDVDKIFEELEGVVDTYYGKENDNEEKTIDYRGNSYAENVDALVARMGSGWH